MTDAQNAVAPEAEDNEEDWSADPPMLDGTRENPIFDKVAQALQEVYDPEIPVDIFKLGLIYRIDVNQDNDVSVVMTLTSPGCPVAGEMPGMVENAVRQVQEVNSIDVELTFDPMWNPGMMSDLAKLELGIF